METTPLAVGFASKLAPTGRFCLQPGDHAAQQGLHAVFIEQTQGDSLLLRVGGHDI